MTQPAQQPHLHSVDITEQEIERLRELCRIVKKERRTLLVQPRFDGKGGLYMALTATPGEIGQRRAVQARWPSIVAARAGKGWATAADLFHFPCDRLPGFWTLCAYCTCSDLSSSTI